MESPTMEEKPAVMLTKLRPLGTYPMNLLNRYRREEKLMVHKKGPLERHLSTAANLGYKMNSSLTATYTTPNPPTKTFPMESQVFTAAAIVLLQHPALSSIPIAPSSSSPSTAHFAHLPSVNLKECITFHPRKTVVPPPAAALDPELDELLEWQLNQPFTDASAPYWRLIILRRCPTGRSFSATFMFHPALADGISALAVHHSFLSALNTRTPSPYAPTLVPACTHPLPPALETGMRFRNSFPFLVKKFCEIYLPWKKRGEKGLWSGSPVRQPKGSRFRSVAILPGPTGKLVLKARKEGTTVQGILQALAAASLFDILSPSSASSSSYNDGGENVMKLSCTVPVSLRGMTSPPVPGKAIGIWCSKTQIRYTDVQMREGVWDEARRSRDEVLRYKARKGKDDAVGLLRYMRNGERCLRRREGKQREGSFEINNIGRFDDGAQAGQPEEEWDMDEWRVGRMMFGRGAGAVDAAVQIMAVTGGDGGLTLGFAWQEGVVDELIVERLMIGLDNGIRKLTI